MSNPKETQAQELARLRAENEAMRAANEAMKLAQEKSITFKVSEKGAVSVYGLGIRFPVTLYKEGWIKLNTVMPKLMQFVEEHDAQLRSKADFIQSKIDAKRTASEVTQLRKV